MTKANLVDEVAALGDLTRRDADVIVETIFNGMIDALRADDKIEIRGFGSFRSRQRKPRTGRLSVTASHQHGGNPTPGQRVDVPAKRVPYFKPSKELRDQVNAAAARHTKPAIES